MIEVGRLLAIAEYQGVPRVDGVYLATKLAMTHVRYQTTASARLIPTQVTHITKMVLISHRKRVKHTNYM